MGSGERGGLSEKNAFRIGGVARRRGISQITLYTHFLVRPQLVVTAESNISLEAFSGFIDNIITRGVRPGITLVSSSPLIYHDAKLI